MDIFPLLCTVVVVFTGKLFDFKVLLSTTVSVQNVFLIFKNCIDVAGKVRGS